MAIESDESSRRTFWRDHYNSRYGGLDALGPTRAMEYSNLRVRLQMYAAVIEVIGEIEGDDVWDAGCGTGTLSRMLDVLGARVIATDASEVMIERLREEFPMIDWRVIDLSDEAVSRLPKFQLVACVEVLQYLDFERCVRKLWDRVRPGGRLVAVVPRCECPITTRVAEQTDGLWKPVSRESLLGLRITLPDVSLARYRNLAFRPDQDLLPYYVCDWKDTLDDEGNRAVIALERRG